MEAPSRVLVLDGHRNHSLSFIRSISEKGVEVTAGCRSRLGPAMLSKHTDRRFIHPNDHEQPQLFIDHLTRYLRKNPHDAIVPLADRSHTILSKHKDRIAETGTSVGVEDWDQFTNANNKKRLFDLAKTLPVPAPDTRSPESVPEVRRLENDVSYPVLLKPRYTSVRDANGVYREARISPDNYVDSSDELVPTFRSMIEGAEYFRNDPPIIQEVVPGKTVATGALAADGSVLTAFQEKRVRTYPIDGGVGAIREAIYEPEMLGYSREIIDALGWTGPVYVEFMMTPEGEFYLIEVNGRYWGSLGLAVNSGIDIPWYHLQQLCGNEIVCPSLYPTGRRQRRLFYTDIRWFLASLRRGDLNAIPTFIESFRTPDDVLSREDPLPTAGSLLWAGKRIMEKTTESADQASTDRARPIPIRETSDSGHE